MYVQITDRGECFSTTMENVNGVYANRDEWAKYGFYPQNGMVGEVVKQTATAYVVKILEGIYVPMTRNGIKAISEQEYKDSLKNNVCSGMDERQRRINSQLDSFNARTGYDWHNNPSMQINPLWQNAFRGELRNNLSRRSNNFTKQLYMAEVTEECVMYSCDMCLHYYKEGAYCGISSHTIEKITYNVCYAMHSLVKEFSSNIWEDVMSDVKGLMADSSTYGALQQKVDKYYNRY